MLSCMAPYFPLISRNWRARAPTVPTGMWILRACYLRNISVSRFRSWGMLLNPLLRPLRPMPLPMPLRLIRIPLSAPVASQEAVSGSVGCGEEGRGCGLCGKFRCGPLLRLVRVVVAVPVLVAARKVAEGPTPRVIHQARLNGRKVVVNLSPSHFGGFESYSAPLT